MQMFFLIISKARSNAIRFCSVGAIFTTALMFEMALFSAGLKFLRDTV